MSRRRISTVVNEDLYLEFVIAATRKFRGKRGCIARAIEEALRSWVEENRGS